MCAGSVAKSLRVASGQHNDKGTDVRAALVVVPAPVCRSTADLVTTSRRLCRMLLL